MGKIAVKISAVQWELLIKSLSKLGIKKGSLDRVNVVSVQVLNQKIVWKATNEHSFLTVQWALDALAEDTPEYTVMLNRLTGMVYPPKKELVMTLGKHLQIRAEGTSFKMESPFAESQVLEPPSAEFADKLTVSGKLLAEAVKHVKFAASPIDNRPALRGLYVRSQTRPLNGSPTELLSFIATDGNKGAEQVIELPGEGLKESYIVFPESFDWVYPGETATRIEFDKTTHWVRVTSKYPQETGNEVLVSVRTPLIDESYPDIDRVFPYQTQPAPIVVEDVSDLILKLKMALGASPNNHYGEIFVVPQGLEVLINDGQNAMVFFDTVAATVDPQILPHDGRLAGFVADVKVLLECLTEFPNEPLNLYARLQLEQRDPLYGQGQHFRFVFFPAKRPLGTYVRSLDDLKKQDTSQAV